MQDIPKLPINMDGFEHHRQFRKLNYELCTAIDLTKLDIVCDKLIDLGAYPERIRSLKAIVNEALQLLRGVNQDLAKDK